MSTLTSTSAVKLRKSWSIGGGLRRIPLEVRSCSHSVWLSEVPFYHGSAFLSQTMTREGVGSLTLCVNVLEELEEVLSLLQGVRGEIDVWHNWRSHDCRDGSQAEEDLGKHLVVLRRRTGCL